MANPLVSVIVPVSGPSERLAECLRGLVSQSYARKELIVVCPGAGAVPLPEGLEGVRVIKEGRADACAARLINRGMRAAKGDIKVMLAPCCVPAGEDWLAKLIRPFEDRAVGAVVSQCAAADRRGLSPTVRLMRSVTHPETRLGHTKPLERQLLSRLCDAFRADVLEEAERLYDEELGCPADVVDLSLRIGAAGRRIVLSPGATVLYHDPAEHRTVRGILRQALDYGRADAVLAGKHGLDWLGSRLYAAALLALLVIPVGLVRLPFGVILAGALFAWGWFLPLRIPLLRWEWPVALLNLALYIALVRGMPERWTAAIFDPREWHPAIVRQWWILVAMTGSYVLLLARAGAGSALRSILGGGGLFGAAGVFALGMLWHLLAGVGYLKGRLFGGGGRAGHGQDAGG